MELSVADVIEVFQEETFPKACNEVLLERGEGFVETITNEIQCLSLEDTLWLEAECLGEL